MPEEGQCCPASHHAGAACGGDYQGQAERNQLHDGFNGQRHALPVDEKGAADQLVEPRGLDGQEHSIEHHERDEGERAESRSLKVEPRPEHGRVAERLEPECVNVIGQRRATAEHREGQDGEQGDANTPLARRRPIDGIAGTPVHVITHLEYSLRLQRTADRSAEGRW